MKVTTLLLVTLFAVATLARFNNKVFIDFKSIVEHVNSVQKSWVAGHNAYFDNKDLKTIKGMMGALETPEHLRLPLKEIEPLEDIPESFDSAERWPDCESLKEVRDQSTCGSCWAFAAAAVLEGNKAIKSGSSAKDISEQQMVDCVYNRDGCQGGWPNVAMDYIKNNGGAYKESDYRYSSSNSGYWNGGCRYASGTKGHKPS